MVRTSLRDVRTGRRVSETRCRRYAPANQRVKAFPLRGTLTRRPVGLPRGGAASMYVDNILHGCYIFARSYGIACSNDRRPYLWMNPAGDQRPAVNRSASSVDRPRGRPTTARHRLDPQSLQDGSIHRPDRNNTSPCTYTLPPPVAPLRVSWPLGATNSLR